MNNSPQKIILDTDIGSDCDDSWALALAIACKEIQLLAVTTVGYQSPNSKKTPSPRGQYSHTGIYGLRDTNETKSRSELLGPALGRVS